MKVTLNKKKLTEEDDPTYTPPWIRYLPRLDIYVNKPFQCGLKTEEEVHSKNAMYRVPQNLNAKSSMEYSGLNIRSKDLSLSGVKLSRRAKNNREFRRFSPYECISRPNLKSNVSMDPAVDLALSMSCLELAENNNVVIVGNSNIFQSPKQNCLEPQIEITENSADSLHMNAYPDQL